MAKEELKGVEGWLWFFAFNLTVLTPIFILISLFSDSSTNVPLIIFNLVFIALAITIGTAIFTKKEKAIIWAKELFTAYLIISIFDLIIYFIFPIDLSNDFLSNPFRNVLVSIIWLLYLNNSKRVRNTFKVRGVNWKRMSIVILLAVFTYIIIILISAFSSPNPIDTQNPITVNNPQAQEINTNINVQENIKQYIVWVKYEVSGKLVDGSYFESGGSGSGVIMINKSNRLKVYTNRHVVDCQYNDTKCFQRISENIQVRTQDGKLHNVDTVSFSKSDIDLAILTIKDSNMTGYSAAPYTNNFKIGENVIAVGYPSYTENVVEFSVKEGKITNIKDVLAQSSGKNFRAIESDAYTYFGSSGGGLFDKQGNLIGINTWGTNSQSIAIDFSSISEEEFTYCDKNSYFSDRNCINYCNREQVLGSDGRCYDLCNGYYCKSKIPQVNDPRCSNPTFVPGSDDYCYSACTINSYCEHGSSCYRNQCVSCSFGTELFEDGTCRKYE